MRQSFDPSIWGPHAWFFLETIVMSYPINPSEKQKINFKSFFYMLQFIIPCDKCRVNYLEHLKDYPLTDTVLKNRDNMFTWIVGVHNSVDPNKRRSAKETYDYYINQYSESPKKDNKKEYTCSKRKKNIFIVVMIILFIIIIHKIYLLF
jgi:hypothetical protein